MALNPKYLDKVRDAVKDASRADVAKAIGVDSSDLGKVLNGGKSPSVAMQAKIVAWADGATPSTETAEKPKRANVAAAKREKKALDEWVKGGRKGAKPETPNLDLVKDQAPAPERAKARTRKTTEGGESKRRPVAETIRFYHQRGDGERKAMPDSQNKLSSVAYYFTGGIVEGKPRISTTELVDLLKANGVDDPSNSAWSVKLPNGITLSATV